MTKRKQGSEAFLAWMRKQIKLPGAKEAYLAEIIGIVRSQAEELQYSCPGARA
jgi:hypothetical protein